MSGAMESSDSGHVARQISDDRLPRIEEGREMNKETQAPDTWSNRSVVLLAPIGPKTLGTGNPAETTPGSGSVV